MIVPLVDQGDGTYFSEFLGNRQVLRTSGTVAIMHTSQLLMRWRNFLDELFCTVMADGVKR
jgi:hypothetical protein